MIFIVSIVFSVFYYFMLKGTIFGLSFRNNTFGGFLLAREIFLLIILGVVLFNVLGVDATNRVFFMNEESIRLTEFYIFYALFVFVFFIGLLSKTFFKKYLVVRRNNFYDNSSFGVQKLLSSSFVSLVFLSCFFYILGMKHAFLSSFFMGGELMSYRLYNAYGTSVPNVLKSLYGFLVVVYAVSIGISSSYLKIKSIIFYIFFLFLFASFLGAKAPVVSSLILFFLAYVSVSDFSLKQKIKFSIISFCFVLIVLFLVVKAQFGSVDIYRFINIIYLRLGTGQIQGAYEQFALKLRDFEYIWHALPLSEMLTNVPRFNKELMMNTYGADLNSYSDTGVMNSFFIGEAFAIGGIALVLASPVIVAFNYILIYFVSFKLFSKYFNMSVSKSRLYIQLIIPSYVVLTGDFTGFLFGKLIIMVFSFFTFIFLLRKCFDFLLPKKKFVSKFINLY